MNDHQRKMARKAKKPAGYRDGGPLRGYEHGGPVDENMRDKAVRDAARSDLFGPALKDPEKIKMREKALRDAVRGGEKPESPKGKMPYRPSFVRG